MPYSAAPRDSLGNLQARFGAFWNSDLSIVSAMTVPPYFFTSGNTEFMLSSSPFTELISAFPLYILIARSSTAGLDESSWSGVSVTACSADTAFLHRFRFVDLGQTYVHIENMRSGFALTHAFVQNVVEIPAPQSLLQLRLSRRIDALADQDRRIGDLDRMRVRGNDGLFFLNRCAKRY